ncbi:MAG: hypothetical protein QF685_01665 [Verrucomicrobiota bacterium]|jgi:hypothetical protein|nr:hypothetical protein [Verrucomicrobiota bacterium]
MKKLLLLAMAVVLVGCCTEANPGEPDDKPAEPEVLQPKPAPQPLPDGLIGKRVPKPLR